MKFSTALRNGTLWLAVCGMFLPSVTFGSGPIPMTLAEIQDVALRPDQSLHGQIVDVDGNVRSNVPVTIIQADHATTTTTDVEGRFVAHHVRGGCCSVQYPDQMQQYRVWTHNAAPPAARHGIVYRSRCGLSCGHGHGCRCADAYGPISGQYGTACHQHGILGGHVGPGIRNTVGGLLTSPIALAAVAATIAVPLALDDDDDDAS